VTVPKSMPSVVPPFDHLHVFILARRQSFTWLLGRNWHNTTKTWPQLGFHVPEMMLEFWRMIMLLVTKSRDFQKRRGKAGYYWFQNFLQRFPELVIFVSAVLHLPVKNPVSDVLRKCTIRLKVRTSDTMI